jgi:hypothetical protein
VTEVNMVRKIASGLYIASANPAAVIAMEARPGGSKVKTLAFAAVMLDKSSGSDTLGIRIDHGPEGQLWVTHTAASLAAVGTMLVVEADAAVILGEYFRAAFVTSTTLNQFFVVDLYEITRPF